MNISFEYYAASKDSSCCPAWVKTERYMFCESFARFFSIFHK